MLGVVHLIHGVELVGVVHQHLVKLQIKVCQVVLLHLALGLFNPRSHLRVLGHALVHRHQAAVLQLHPVLGAGQGEYTQIFAVLSSGDDVGIIDLNGLLQGGVGVAGDDDVDAVHLLGQLVVLPLPLLGARVGQADDHGVLPIGVLALLRGLLHHTLGGLHRVMEFHSRHGRALVGVHPGDAKDHVGHAAPLQDSVILHPVGVQSVPGLFILLRRQIVGVHNGGQRVPAVHGGVEHIGQAGGAVVKLMVAKGGDIVPHLAHGPQLQSGSGIGRLEQAAHGEVASVQHQGVGVPLLLLINEGFQPGIAPSGVPVRPLLGQEAGVHIVGI